MRSELHDHLDPDAVIDFAGGLLTPGQRGSALAHAARCARCERSLQRVIGVGERARAAHAARGEALMPAREPAFEPAPAPRPKAIEPAAWRRRLAGWLAPRRAVPALAFGALATILAVTLLPWRAPRRALERIHPLPAGAELTTTRDAAGTVHDGEVRAGLEAYTRGDLAGARRALESARTQGPLELVRRIYLANALARQGEHRAAVALLETVAFDQVPEPWSGESRWTLAASLRALGEPARADSLLEAIAEDPGPVGDRARGLLQRR